MGVVTALVVAGNRRVRRDERGGGSGDDTSDKGSDISGGDDVNCGETASDDGSGSGGHD